MNSPGVRRGAESKPTNAVGTPSAKRRDTGLPFVQRFPVPDGWHAEVIREQAETAAAHNPRRERPRISRPAQPAGLGSTASRPGLQPGRGDGRPDISTRRQPPPMPILPAGADQSPVSGLRRQDGAVLPAQPRYENEALKNSSSAHTNPRRRRDSQPAPSRQGAFGPIALAANSLSVTASLPGSGAVTGQTLRRRAQRPAGRLGAAV